MHFNYLTALRYCARGQSEKAKLSRLIKDQFKNGNEEVSTRLATILKEQGTSEYFKNSFLVPVPKSAPLIINALFPAKVICETLLENGFGDQTAPILVRKHAIMKSSSAYTAETRTSLTVIYESLEAKLRLIAEPTIIVVDDILTLGRNAFASAALLQQTYPDKQIKIFTAFRTRGNDNGTLVDLKYGVLTINGNKTDVVLPD